MSGSTWIIVYDLDGTLLNTLEDIAFAANKALTQIHPTCKSFELPVVKTMIGDGARILMERMLTAATLRTPEKPEVDEAFRIFLD